MAVFGNIPYFQTNPHGSGMFIETVGWSPHLEIPHEKISKCQVRMNVPLDPGWSNQIQGVPSLAAVSNGNPQPIPTKSQRASTFGSMTNQKCLVPSKIERICGLIIIQIWGFGGKLEFEPLQRYAAFLLVTLIIKAKSSAAATVDVCRAPGIVAQHVVLLPSAICIGST